MVYFYKNAIALVHPSFSEGFGLPLVEAMHFKCAIIASDIPVFKELLGEKYVSFKPTDVGDIASQLSMVKTREDVDYGDRLSEFSFKLMSRKTLEIYKHNV